MVSLGQGQQPGGRKPTGSMNDVGTIVNGATQGVNLGQNNSLGQINSAVNIMGETGLPSFGSYTGKNRPFSIDFSQLGGGQTWKQLSNQFGVDVDKLKKLNPNLKRPGQQDDGSIRLRRLPGRVEYQQGQRWQDLANQYGVSVEDLKRFNPNIGRLRDVEAGTNIRLRARPGSQGPVQNSLDPWDAIQLNEQRFDIGQGLADTLADISLNRGMENLRYRQTRENVTTNLSRSLDDLQRDRGINMTRLIDNLGARGLTGSGVANRFRNLATEGFDTSRTRINEDAATSYGNLDEENLAFNLGLDAQVTSATTLEQDLLDQLKIREQYLRTQGAAAGVNAGGA